MRITASTLQFRKLAATGILAALMSPAAANADDFAPPAYRGLPGTVMAEWEFLSPPANPLFIPPDTFAWVPGLLGEQLYTGFQTHAEVDNVANWTWTSADGDGGLTPTTTQGAALTFKVADIVDLLPLKDLRVQVTYSGMQPTLIDVSGFGGIPVFISPPNGGLPGNTWWDVVFQPNPLWESVTFGVPFGTVIDEVVIDTWSMPSPGAVSLLGLGVIAATLRRRR